MTHKIPEDYSAEILSVSSRPSDWDFGLGYKQPPIQNRFKPGQSGNPKGRRKSVPEDFSDIVSRKMLSKAIDPATGKTLKITNLEAILSVAIDQAAQGDKQATANVLRLIQTADVVKETKYNVEEQKRRMGVL